MLYVKNIEQKDSATFKPGNKLPLEIIFKGGDPLTRLGAEVNSFLLGNNIIIEGRSALTYNGDGTVTAEWSRPVNSNIKAMKLRHDVEDIINKYNGEINFGAVWGRKV